MNQKEYELIAYVIRARKENINQCAAFGYSERDITAARDVLDDLQWFMSYELANTYDNFDGKMFEDERRQSMSELDTPLNYEELPEQKRKIIKRGGHKMPKTTNNQEVKQAKTTQGLRKDTGRAYQRCNHSRTNNGGDSLRPWGAVCK
jgi:hypothetical protein